MKVQFLLDLVKLFKQHKISFSLILNEEDDLMTTHELRVLIEHLDFFEQLFRNYHLISIKTNDDFLMFMLSKKLIAMGEYLHVVKSSDSRDKISKLIKEIKRLNLKQYIGQSVKYINKNFENLLSKNKENLFEEKKVVLDSIKKNQNSISDEVFRFLCKNYSDYLIYEFDSFKKHFKKNPDQFELLFNKVPYLELGGYRLNLILNIFLKMKDNKELKKIVNESIDSIYNSLIQKLRFDRNNVSINFLMRKLDIVNALSLYFKKTKDKRYNKLKEFPNLLQKEINKDIEKNGVEFKTDIPLSDILERFNKSIPKSLRLIFLTHKLSHDGCFHSNFDLEPENEKKSFLDIIHTNVATDKYYTFSRQQNLNIIITLGGGLLFYFVKDYNIFKELKTDIEKVFKYIDSENEIEKDVFEKGSLLIAALKNILPVIKTEEDNKSFIVMSQCYNIEMLCCSLIEKLLRIVYIDHNQSVIYIPEDKTTLGILLETNNSSNFSCFGKNHLKSLAFFLLKSGEKRIGYNYRNRLAHLTKIDCNILSPVIAMQMLYLFIDVLNSTYFYFAKKK